MLLESMETVCNVQIKVNTSDSPTTFLYGENIPNPSFYLSVKYQHFLLSLGSVLCVPLFGHLLLYSLSFHVGRPPLLVLHFCRKDVFDPLFQGSSAGQSVQDFFQG